ncbi:acyl-CoA dehydrogenase family protein [Halalkalibacterium ligniniphilum]|uniref:acyl-CoA dehydrogenase family protein n=1 Tax=Halalkalibacterium ligniniphilum TaxID=1134413 RepID=UPI000349F9EE
MNASYLTAEHQMFRKALRNFLEKEAYPHYAQWEKDRIIPREPWHKMGREDFYVLGEMNGGVGADISYSVVLIEEREKVGSSLLGIGLHNDIVLELAGKVVRYYLYKTKDLRYVS